MSYEAEAADEAGTTNNNNRILLDILDDGIWMSMNALM